MSEVMIDHVSTVYDALDRAMRKRPYTVVRMHPETAAAVRRAAVPYDGYDPLTTPPSLLGMTLIVDDSVEPGHFRFEYEVAATLRGIDHE